MVEGRRCGNGSVNSKRANHPRVFVGHLSSWWSGTVVGNLSENLCPGVGHLSSLLEAVNIVPLSIFHLKICPFG